MSKGWVAVPAVLLALSVATARAGADEPSATVASTASPTARVVAITSARTPVSTVPASTSAPVKEPSMAVEDSPIYTHTATPSGPHGRTYVLCQKIGADPGWRIDVSQNNDANNRNRFLLQVEPDGIDVQAAREKYGVELCLKFEPSQTPTPTVTPSESASQSVTPTATQSPTESPSSSSSVSATSTPSSSPSPSLTTSESPSGTDSPSASPTATDTITHKPPVTVCIGGDPGVSVEFSTTGRLVLLTSIILNQDGTPSNEPEVVFEIPANATGWVYRPMDLGQWLVVKLNGVELLRYQMQSCETDTPSSSSVPSPSEPSVASDTPTATSTSSGGQSATPTSTPVKTSTPTRTTTKAVVVVKTTAYTTPPSRGLAYTGAQVVAPLVVAFILLVVGFPLAIMSRPRRSARKH